MQSRSDVRGPPLTCRLSPVPSGQASARPCNRQAASRARSPPATLFHLWSVPLHGLAGWPPLAPTPAAGPAAAGALAAAARSADKGSAVSCACSCKTGCPLPFLSLPRTRHPSGCCCHCRWPVGRFKRFSPHAHRSDEAGSSGVSLLFASPPGAAAHTHTHSHTRTPTPPTHLGPDVCRAQQAAVHDAVRHRPLLAAPALLPGPPDVQVAHQVALSHSKPAHGGGIGGAVKLRLAPCKVTSRNVF